MPDADKIFERWVNRLVPVWGPIYAIFYITRLVFREMFRKKD